MSAAMYHAHMTVAQQLLRQLQHITTPPRVAVTEQVLAGASTAACITAK